MAVLFIPKTSTKKFDYLDIKLFLAELGIWHEQWEVSGVLTSESSEKEILAAYNAFLEPFMNANNYFLADVINVNQETQNLDGIRRQFLKEHTHREDEVRFFIDGEGLFWFHIEGQVFSLLCRPGDLISVPANTKHWFDLGPKPFVKAIRIFTAKSGWIPEYTESGVDSLYNPKY